MAHKFDYPETESQLKNILDQLYSQTKTAIAKGEKPRFKGLIEIMSSDATIVTAVHNIKSNKGSGTVGADEITMEMILQTNYDEVIQLVHKNFRDYKPVEVRRVWIPKPGKSEKRPLGIPAIVDRIIQECMRIVLDPIFEAQFISHSYGFRPFRSAHHALKRVTTIIHRTKHRWIVEGDISKFFDNVNHRILLQTMWGMGIRDQRALMMVRAMLRAGIMGETKVNPMGTPQGGIISPLLANIYLHRLDEWITREWENKETKYPYAKQEKMYERLRVASKLKPAYYIRYADDWILVTDSKENAEKWKTRISQYLEEHLKLKLSDEKTLITNCTRKSVKFLGFEIKAHIEYRRPKGKANDKSVEKTREVLITRVSPQMDRFKVKVHEINNNIKRFKRIPKLDDAIHHLNIINSQIRGVVNYYSPATNIGEVTKKYSSLLYINGWRYLRRYGGQIVRTSEVRNLLEVHSAYNQSIPAMDVGNGTLVGLTNISFVKWTEPTSKNQDETPYSIEGREIHKKRTNKSNPLTRADELFSLKTSWYTAEGLRPRKYNFEYYMNRGYVINRDRGKCRVCKSILEAHNVQIHHCNPKLPLKIINKVMNLAAMCDVCHGRIHDGNDYSSNLDEKIWQKIKQFRDKLELTKRDVS